MEGLIVKIAGYVPERGFAVALMTVLLMIFPGHQARAADAGASPTDAKTEFAEFAGLRSEVLTMIGGATKRVWIATDFLTDG